MKKILETEHITASAPCRIDLGGTLDISTFYYPLRHLDPCTFNIAINLRTSVTLLPYQNNMIKVSSRGFESAQYLYDRAPFDHPLGLMFAVAAYFRARDIHIIIDSPSPPRSALGGSSAAAVALVAALSKVSEQGGKSGFSRQNIAMLAHELESCVAGVPCGLQDQLAAAFGGVNAWYWQPAIDKRPCYKKMTVIKKQSFKELKKHLLLAYCGIPHESKHINQKWVKQFLAGNNRKLWSEIIACTKNFIKALSVQDYKIAAESMNLETAIRKEMTPDVLDDTGVKLVDTAIAGKCGARFTGAGGGGCVWAIGETDNIGRLKSVWKKIIANKKEACLLDVDIDSKGLAFTDHESMKKS